MLTSEETIYYFYSTLVPHRSKELNFNQKKRSHFYVMSFFLLNGCFAVDLDYKILNSSRYMKEREKKTLYEQIVCGKKNVSN